MISTTGKSEAESVERTVRLMRNSGLLRETPRSRRIK
jgi:hypothetical protein